MDEFFVGDVHRWRSTQSRDSVPQLDRMSFFVFGDFLQLSNRTLIGLLEDCCLVLYGV